MNTDSIQIGDGVTACGWSDRQAATVIAKTAKSITIQYDKQKLINHMKSNEPDKLTMSVGGFCGHASGTQRWKCEPDVDGWKTIARLRKNGRFYCSKDGRQLIEGRFPYYDFNF